MVGKVRFAVSGLKEFSAGLGELSIASQKGVLRRVALKAGKPMAERAAELAPKDTHDLERSITVASKTIAETDAGKLAYHNTMAGGGSKADAKAALISARRAAKGARGESYVEVFIGPERGSKRRAIKAMAQEFGSVNNAPQPYLRPALAGTKDLVIGIVKAELAGEIRKAAARAAKKAMKKAGKGS